jgi:hypothetical protein
MTPADKARVFLRALEIRLRADLSAAEAQADAAARELGKAPGVPEPATMAFVSVAIDRAYTAIESGFAHVAREIDGVPAQGDGWDAWLLHQMILPIQDRRPAIIGAETAARLEVLRRHRHWLRHAYSTIYSWKVMQPAVRAFGPAVTSLRADLERFLVFLTAD